MEALLTIGWKKIPFIQDVTLHFVELLPKEAAGLECNIASLPGPATPQLIIPFHSSLLARRSRSKIYYPALLLRQPAHFCCLDQ